MMENLRDMCTKLGYFGRLHTQEMTRKAENVDTDTSCRHFATCKTLPADFNWSNIPMLSVLSGVNGVGKTALLHSIVLAHPYSGKKCGMSRDVSIHLKYNERSIDNSIIVANLLNEICHKIETHDDLMILNHRIESNQTELREEYENNMQEKTQIFYYSTVSDENPKFSYQMNFISIENHCEDLLTCSHDVITYARKKRENKQQQWSDLYEHIIDYFDKLRENQPEHFASNKTLVKRDSTEEYYDQLHNFYGYCCLHHVKKCTSASDTLLFLLVTTTTIDKLNEFLQGNKSNYTIDSVSHKNDPYKLDARVKNRFDGRVTELHVLSPGEQFHFLNLLLQYEIEFSPPISPVRVHPPAILLLDEPDAHLHPNWIKDFMSCITKLAAHRKIQVIMTTQKATTIRYVPFDKCLFIMTRDTDTDCVRIDQATDKNQVVQLLTSNVLQINENFRLVFVEANDDKMFYASVRKNLYRYKCLHDAHPLLFECFGTLVKSTTYDPRDGKRKSLDVDSSNRDHVIDLVKKLTNTADDEELSLKNFIYGLVDGDNVTENKQLENYNILTLDRHSIENYIYDPIHIFFFLLPQLDKFLDGKNDKSLEKIKEIQCSMNIKPETTIDHILGREDASSVLQKIIDCVSDLFTGTLNDILQNSSTEENKKLFKGLQDTRNEPDSDPTSHKMPRPKRDVQLLNNNDKLIDNGKSDVRIVNNIGSEIIVKYPVLLLKIQGHSTATVYSKVHHSLKMDKLLQFIQEQMIIPEDLSNILKKLLMPSLTQNISSIQNTSQATTIRTLPSQDILYDTKTIGGLPISRLASSTDSTATSSNTPKVRNPRKKDKKQKFRQHMIDFQKIGPIR